jgi:hypothetical protein
LGELALSESVAGRVISVHQLGATVRLEDGTLAAIPAGEVAANRPALVRSLQRREPLTLIVKREGRHPVALLPKPGSLPGPRPAPQLVDAGFEDRLTAYLKSTEEWAPPDRPQPAERHFIRKKRRAAFFEARTKPT